MLPLVIAILVIIIKEYWIPQRTLGSVPKKAWHSLGLAVLVCITGLFGLLGHIMLLHYFAGAQMAEGISVHIASIDSMYQIFLSYFELFGHQDGRFLLTMGGIVSITGIVSAIIMFGLSIHVLIEKDKPLPKAIAGLMYPITMGLLVFIFMFNPNYHDYFQYFITAFMWIIPLLGVLLDKDIRSWKSITLKQVLVAFVCLSFIVSGVFYNRYFVQPEGKQVHYDSPGYITVDVLHHLDGAWIL